MIKLTDAHTHLEAFSDAGKGPETGAEIGLSAVVLNAAREADWNEILALAEHARSAGVFIFPQFGLHPWYLEEAAEGWPARLEAVLETAREKNLPGVGVGEIGLDRLKAVDAAGSADEASWRRQMDAFRVQFRLAGRMKMPVSVHGVRCWDVLFQEISAAISALRDVDACPRAVIFHAFSGPAELSRQWLTWEAGERGRPPCYFSFSPSILDPARKKMRETAKTVPLDRLLVETDMHVGGEAEMLFSVVQEISRLRGDETPETLAAACERNLRHVFFA